MFLVTNTLCYRIVGIGSHSRDGVQKLKPAVEELCRIRKLQVVEEGNPGRVYISLSTSPRRDQIRKAQTPPPRVSTRRTSEQQQHQQQQQDDIFLGESTHYRHSPSGFRHRTPSPAPGVPAARPPVVPISDPTDARPLMPHPQDSEGEGESADVPEELPTPWSLWGLAAAVVVILVRRFLRF